MQSLGFLQSLLSVCKIQVSLIEGVLSPTLHDTFSNFTLYYML